MMLVSIFQVEESHIEEVCSSWFQGYSCLWSSVLSVTATTRERERERARVFELIPKRTKKDETRCCTCTPTNKTLASLDYPMTHLESNSPLETMILIFGAGLPWVMENTDITSHFSKLLCSSSTNMKPLSWLHFISALLAVASAKEKFRFYS